MLVLSRKPGESLKLGDDIEITVLKASAGQVSLGITAPRSLAILRGELVVAVLNENRTAAAKAPASGDLEELSRTWVGKETEKPQWNKKEAGAESRPGRKRGPAKAHKRRP